MKNIPTEDIELFCLYGNFVIFLRADVLYKFSKRCAINDRVSGYQNLRKVAVNVSIRR